MSPVGLPMSRPPLRPWHGVVAVELALGMVVFLTFLFLVIEIARYAQQRNLLMEATRQGARIAATCSNTSAIDQLIVNKMSEIGRAHV